MELADAIRSGRASSREVIDAHLERIEEVNPSINAITVVLGEQALEAAEAADRVVARGGDLAPLHGVPFTVKENIDLEGTPTTLGLKALAGSYPNQDAPVVARLRAAGAIPIGRTNCPTLTVRWHTESELWGATINPWDRSRTPGASSGGEAAALATGMTPLGLGSDGLGSLRWPAQCCGVGALKPSLGRIPSASSVEPVNAPIGVQLTAVQGPMARRVADLRTALEVTSGQTWRDPWTVPAPLRGPEPVKPIRVAVVVDPAAGGIAPQVRKGVCRAAETLEAAGYAVEEVEPPSIDRAAKILLDLLNTPEVRAGWKMMSPSLPPDTQRFMSAFYEAAGDPDAETIMQSFMIRQSLLRAWGVPETHPLIVGPIFTDIPFEAGSDLDNGHVAETIHGMRLTLAVNALALPAGHTRGHRGRAPAIGEVIGALARACASMRLALEDRLGIITPIDPVATRRSHDVP
jgi:amidase